MEFSTVKSQMRFEDNKFLFIVETELARMIEEGLWDELRESLKEQLATEEIKQVIFHSIEKFLASADAKETLTRMIAEVVSETIKTTIMELKQQGVI